MTKVSMIFYIADKEINSFMRACDMGSEDKVYYSERGECTFTAASKVDEEYIRGLIEKSRSQPDFWIPAILWENKLYVAKEILQLSDGKKIMVIRENLSA